MRKYNKQNKGERSSVKTSLKVVAALGLASMQSQSEFSVLP
jgi:hypothetical protein